MDNEKMVTKLKSIIKELSEDNGLFSLVMLTAIEPQDLNSKYNLLISAPWLDNKNLKQSIMFFVIKIRSVMNEDEFSNISRINIIRSTDQFVQSINSAFGVSGGSANISNCNIFGIQIDRAILLESNRLGDFKAQARG